MRSLPCAATLVAALFLAAPVLHSQDAPASGFALAGEPFDGSTTFAATHTLSSGDFVVFDGLQVLQNAPDGTLRRLLATFPSFAFPSFVLTDADELRLFVGESSNGHIWKLTVGFATPPELVTTLAFNYDAAFSGNALYVSSANCGLACGNEIWRVDLFTNQLRLVARTPGASGPLAVDPAGNLYYANASARFPPPPKPSAVWRWSAAQLAGPDVLDLSDALFLGGGFAGAARLAYDSRDGALFLLEVNFATGENRLRRVQGSSESSPVLVEGQLFRSMGNLSLVPGEGPARLRPYQPASGGTLVYTTTDFVAPPERLALRPQRPTATLTGPGLSGPGPFQLALTGGPPNGFAVVLCGPSASYQPVEPAYVLAGLPLFLGLDLGSLLVLPGFLPLDASGALQASYVNPGGLQGRFALQLALYASGQLVGSSSAAFL
jgi:hypothetical protein